MLLILSFGPTFIEVVEVSFYNTFRFYPYPFYIEVRVYRLAKNIFEKKNLLKKEVKNSIELYILNFTGISYKFLKWGGNGVPT